MDSSSPFEFIWRVDQGGYEIRRQQPGLISEVEVEFVVGRGGTERRYRPLEDPTLWLRFGNTCRDPDGVLEFACKFGLLREPNLLAYGTFGLKSLGPGDLLADTLSLAAYVRNIAELLMKDRRTAMELFNLNRPTMTEYIFWKREQKFEYRWVPLSLRDAVLHQIGDAITGNRQFRRCLNPGCPEWFRLGPGQARESGDRRTTTVRRKFCSDYCRVAAARRQKREAATNA